MDIEKEYLSASALTRAGQEHDFHLIYITNRASLSVKREIEHLNVQLLNSCCICAKCNKGNSEKQEDKIMISCKVYHSSVPPVF